MPVINRMLYPQRPRPRLCGKTGAGDSSSSHYGPVIPRRVRAPGLHPPQNRPLVGRVPSPGVPISSIMRIAAATGCSSPGQERAKKEAIPMEVLWRSYGIPMEVLWNNTGTTREQRAGSTGAGGLRYRTGWSNAARNWNLVWRVSCSEKRRELSSPSPWTDGKPENRNPKSEGRTVADGSRRRRRSRGKRAAEGWAVVNTEVARGAFGFPSRFTFHASELTP